MLRQVLISGHFVWYLLGIVGDRVFATKVEDQSKTKIGAVLQSIKEMLRIDEEWNRC